MIATMNVKAGDSYVRSMDNEEGTLPDIQPQTMITAHVPTQLNEVTAHDDETTAAPNPSLRNEPDSP